MRQPRHLVEGAWYHVTARANRREMLLDRGEVRDLFLVFLARARKRYRFEVNSIQPEKIADPDGQLFQPPPDYHEIEPLPF